MTQKAMPTETNGQAQRPSSEQDRIDLALHRMSIRLDKVLSESAINQWHQDLSGFPIAAIEYACDWCGLNLERWPKPKQFKEAINAWYGREEGREAEAPIPSGAEIEQRRREWRQWYNSPEANDVRALVEQLDKKMNAGRPKLYARKP
jgi:hypothetical protein